MQEKIYLWGHQDLWTAERRRDAALTTCSKQDKWSEWLNSHVLTTASDKWFSSHRAYRQKPSEVSLDLHGSQDGLAVVQNNDIYKQLSLYLIAFSQWKSRFSREGPDMRTSKKVVVLSGHHSTKRNHITGRYEFSAIPSNRMQTS